MIAFELFLPLFNAYYGWAIVCYHDQVSSSFGLPGLALTARGLGTDFYYCAKGCERAVMHSVTILDLFVFLYLCANELNQEVSLLTRLYQKKM